MTKSIAVAVMRAAEKVRSAERRVVDCQRALAKAEKARDRAGADYLQLVRDSLPERKEVNEVTA
ncbi:MAG: hypothetical protein IRZ28_13250 [Steroidobacteraceae bacterium]|nr:hypothetical protein [Steroidobacteraceae bacterium]